METILCPNCKTPIKEAFLNSVYLSSPSMVKLINGFSEGSADGYCSKCEPAFQKVAIPKFIKERQRYLSILESLINNVPVLSIPNPSNWEYTSISIVTGQSVLGTGLLSEVTSSFTDFFGAQSGAYNKKLIEGENFCLNILRKKALDLGCNAIIGTDIDYSEAGSLKGMLMVCMAGTAIRVKNPDYCFQDPGKIETLMNVNSWLQHHSDIVI
jgi:uncharacterized protein YbjQ (UPF0145 family)